MVISFDPVKNDANIAKHGLSFATFVGFDGVPVVTEDNRFDYGEARFRAFGRVDGNACCLVSPSAAKPCTRSVFAASI